MKIKTLHVIKKPEEPMISLINIIFLLLIFFMLMGRVEKNNPVNIDAPIASNALKPQPSAHSLSVDRVGRIYIEQKQYSLQSAVEQVNSWKKAGIITDTNGLSIKADLHLQNDLLNELFKALKAIGLYKVKLTVVQK